MLWNRARSSTNEKHSSMIAHRLASFFSGFFGLEKSSRARTMVLHRLAWVTIFSTDTRRGSSAGSFSRSRWE